MHPWIPSIRLHHFLSIGHGDGILRPRHGEGSRDQQLRRGLVTEVVCHRTGGRLKEENVQVQPKDIEVPKARRSWRLFQVEKTENTKGSFENHKIGILMKNFQGILICKLEKKIYIYIYDIPSGYLTVRHGKSFITWRFIAGKIICFNGPWLP